MATAALSFPTQPGTTPVANPSATDPAFARDWQRYQQILAQLKAIRIELAASKLHLGQRLAIQVGSAPTEAGAASFKAWLKVQGLTVARAYALIRATQPRPARVTPAICLRGQTLTVRLSPRHTFFLHHAIEQLVANGETNFILAELLINHAYSRLKHSLQRMVDQMWHEVKHTFSSGDCRKLPPIAVPFGTLSEKP